ncbi:hypothetical protein GOFOIKOB_6400 [Methylobacterium tardum]|nr:hypothetical protein GOFOIKOB_6400 [Methylobacterium tardum]
MLRNNSFHSLYTSAKAHIRRLFKSREVISVKVKIDPLRKANYVVVMVVRNEGFRLEHLIKYHQKIGFEHFIIIDNESSDGTIEKFKNRSNVSLFRAIGSYRDARFGIDWVNHIASKYCVGKWVLHIDADEYFVYPNMDTVNIATFTDELQSKGRVSLQCLMLDMYSRHPVAHNVVLEGQDPVSVCSFFDRTGYRYEYEPLTNTTWIKGGVRSRIFFSELETGPALNKTPLVLWRRHFAFLKSSHQLWPFCLNGRSKESFENPTGALLHYKFLFDFNHKIKEELLRKQHTQEYTSYAANLDAGLKSTYFDPKISAEFVDWKSLLQIMDIQCSKSL